MLSNTIQKMLLFIIKFHSLLFARVFSFFVSVYVRPVVVLGSTLVKMLLEGIISTSGTFGYLYECAGPCGCNKVTLTSELILRIFIKNICQPPVLIVT